MSYQGYTEYLTASGRYFVRDVYDLYLQLSTDPIVYTHSVDETNGFEADNPNTYPAAKVCIGTLKHQHVDVEGNSFVTYEYLYKPLDPSEWNVISPTTAETVSG